MAHLAVLLWSLLVSWLNCQSQLVFHCLWCLIGVLSHIIITCTISPRLCNVAMENLSCCSHFYHLCNMLCRLNIYMEVNLNDFLEVCHATPIFTPVLSYIFQQCTSKVPSTVILSQHYHLAVQGKDRLVTLIICEVEWSPGADWIYTCLV